MNKINKLEKNTEFVWEFKRGFVESSAVKNKRTKINTLLTDSEQKDRNKD